MIDINLIRNDPESVRTALLKRMKAVDFTELLSWDEERRGLIAETDVFKARRNEVSGDIPRKKKAGEDVQDLLGEMKKVSADIKTKDARIGEVDRLIKDFLDGLPNIPADDVPAGGKENNEIISSWGEKPVFSFETKNHVDLVTSLGLIDYDRGVKIGGNGFWLYKGDGAVLEWALLNYFIAEHRKDGYEFILPPHILNHECGYSAGQFPKFADDVFHLVKEEKEQDQFLLPTSETALINYHRDEIIPEDSLPLKYFAYTPCYRKEAGSYRSQERGMIRGHQFNKVEMFQYTSPEGSESAYQELVNKAESLMQGLGLHYRVSRLAAEDCSAAMAKTFDIEVWIPSMNDYKEVSSISNAHEYQARRGNIRLKRTQTKKNAFIHSLNASGLATSRIMPAIVEQHQQEDGSVLVPEVLQGFLGKDRLVSATPAGK
ncbi:MAG: serine--tRNA ligase [Spirochaetales bacterium]|nr:serine--tRNA ligase [Spirochaetales bacterium]